MEMSVGHIEFYASKYWGQNSRFRGAIVTVPGYLEHRDLKGVQFCSVPDIVPQMEHLIGTFLQDSLGHRLHGAVGIGENKNFHKRVHLPKAAAYTDKRKGESEYESV